MDGWAHDDSIYHTSIAIPFRSVPDGHQPSWIIVIQDFNGVNMAKKHYHAIFLCNQSQHC